LRGFAGWCWARRTVGGRKFSFWGDSCGLTCCFSVIFFPL
jgi:hypothetical protein